MKIFNKGKRAFDVIGKEGKSIRIDRQTMSLDLSERTAKGLLKDYPREFVDVKTAESLNQTQMDPKIKSKLVEVNSKLKEKQELISTLVEENLQLKEKLKKLKIMKIQN